MVVAQLVERSFTTPEVHSSNLVIGKMYVDRVLYGKDENEEKRVREWPILKKYPNLSSSRVSLIQFDQVRSLSHRRAITMDFRFDTRGQ